MSNLVCPKCGKGVIRRSNVLGKPYWSCHCFWCGCDFRQAKTHVRAKDRKSIERIK